MKQVFKYELEPDRGPATNLAVPKGSRVIHAGRIDGKYFVWVELNPELPYDIEIEIGIFGTGWDIPEDMIWISTFYQETSTLTFVWHVYGRIIE